MAGCNIIQKINIQLVPEQWKNWLYQNTTTIMIMKWRESIIGTIWLCQWWTKSMEIWDLVIQRDFGNNSKVSNNRCLLQSYKNFILNNLSTLYPYKYSWQGIRWWRYSTCRWTCRRTWSFGLLRTFNNAVWHKTSGENYWEISSFHCTLCSGSIWLHKNDEHVKKQ